MATSTSQPRPFSTARATSRLMSLSSASSTRPCECAQRRVRCAAARAARPPSARASTSFSSAWRAGLVSVAKNPARPQLRLVADGVERGQQHQSRPAERRLALDRTRQLGAVHARHLHVDQRQLERPPFARRDAQPLQCPQAVGRAFDRKPHALAWCIRIWRLVALSSTTSRRAPSSSRGCAARRAATGSSTRLKRNTEPRPGALLTSMRAAHHLDQLLRDREAEAGAAVAARCRAVGLREGLEQAGALRLADADAGVAHGEQQRRRAAPDRRCTSIATSPRSVNLMALPSRLISTWRSRCGSPRTAAGRSGCTCTVSSRPLRVRARGQQIGDVLDHGAQVELGTSRARACRLRSSRSRGCR